ncbi:unnamed protein product [Pocillopora meandrina]|uniref:Uncharacterized protein n=1 Tax=Pocillopora meandrina TaxID=46732 RepID=A0AAU9XVU7_9CNID|nr:unnamed protein product [Pocillopora meandrina]
MVKRFQFTAVLSFGKEDSVGMFRCPWGVAVNATDCHNHRIQIFDRNGDYLRSFLSDQYQHCIKVYDRSGNLQYKFGKEGEGNGEFNYPTCLSVNKSGHLMVCDSYNHRIQVFELNGKFFQ